MVIRIILILISLTATVKAESYKIQYEYVASKTRVIISHGNAFCVGDYVYSALHIKTGEVGNYFYDWDKDKRVAYLIVGKRKIPLTEVTKKQQYDTIIFHKPFIKIKSLDWAQPKLGSITIQASLEGEPIKKYEGYLLRKWFQVGSVCCLLKQEQFKRGGSGSPVLQNGKVIGMAWGVQKKNNVRIGVSMIPFEYMRYKE